MNETKPEDAPVVQAYGHLLQVRIGLPAASRHRSVAALNRLLAHAMALRDQYKKAHWQASGATFYQLHLLFDKHHSEQLTIADALAERVQTLGGVALALARDVVEESHLSRAPRGREAPRGQLVRLADAHEAVLMEARPLARQAADDGDDGTSDIVVSGVVRLNERQAWFIAEQLSGAAT